MPQIKKFFECLLPVSACNLKCEYYLHCGHERVKMLRRK